MSHILSIVESKTLDFICWLHLYLSRAHLFTYEAQALSHSFKIVHIHCVYLLCPVWGFSGVGGLSSKYDPRVEMVVNTFIQYLPTYYVYALLN